MEIAEIIVSRFDTEVESENLAFLKNLLFQRINYNN